MFASLQQKTIHTIPAQSHPISCFKQILPKKKISAIHREIMRAAVTAWAAFSLLLGICLPLPVLAGASSYETKEYHKTYALRRIHASSAYAQGNTGSGVTVAVLDSGIDGDHAELKGKIVAGGINFVNSDSVLSDPIGHGTMVSGIISARKDGKGMHGVAFNSKVLPIRVMDGDGVVDDRLSYKGILHAVSKRARILNLSYGGIGANVTALGIVKAVSAGKIVVIAAGNDSRAYPSEPANFAGYSWARDQVIAVGSVDTKNRISSFSNRAGSFCAENYLVAPGDRIYTTDANGRYKWVSGTSFAAPYVSGAAALLLQEYPHLTAAQVVNLLLATATDLGAPGVDAVYGRGMVNLSKAMQPQGTLTVPSGYSVSGAAASLNGTGLYLGAAFGSRLNSTLLKKAIILDEYGRAYGADLSAAVTGGRRAVFPERFFYTGSDDVMRFDVSVPGLNRFTADIVRRSEDESLPDGEQEKATTALGFHLSAETDWGTVGFGSGLPVSLSAGPFLIEPPAVEHGLAGGDMLENPFLDMLDGSGFLQFQKAFGQSGADIGLLYARGEEQPSWQDTRTALAGAIGWKDRWSRLALTAGMVTEESGILETIGDGAFGVGSDTPTAFVSFAGTRRITETVDISGTVSYGYTRVTPSGESVLKDFSPLQSLSASLAVGIADLFAKADCIVFAVSHPLRIVKGSATVDIPVGRTLTGEVIREREQIDLSPSAAQVDMEMAYRRMTSAVSSLTANLLFSFNPGNDADASNAWGAALKWTKRF